jgi:hypothetical protein
MVSARYTGAVPGAGAAALPPPPVVAAQASTFASLDSQLAFRTQHPATRLLRLDDDLAQSITDWLHGKGAS